MEITKIEESRKKPGMYNIYADDEFLCSAHKNIIAELRLKVGMSFEGEDKKNLLRELQYKKALDNAFNILGRATKTEAELRKKLREKDICEDVISDVIKRLLELGYIDDEAYVELWLRGNSGKAGMNRRTIFNKLRLKGLDKELIESKLEEDPIDEYASAVTVAQKKLRSLKGEARDKKRKLYAYLLGKGFTPDICYKVVNGLDSEGF